MPKRLHARAMSGFDGSSGGFGSPIHFTRAVKRCLDDLMANDDNIRLSPITMEATTNAGYTEVDYHELTSSMLASARNKTRFVTDSVNLYTW